MRIALFGGSFDPVHREHLKYAEAAVKALSLDKLIVLPSHVAPHKRDGAAASGSDRLTMCRLAFEKIACAEVSDFELSRGETSYTYLTAEHFSGLYPEAKIFLLVGADMLEDFFTWKYPERIVKAVTLAACGRGKEGVNSLHERFVSTFGTDYCEVPFSGAEVSSTQLRCYLAFGKEHAALPEKVAQYIREKGLYTYPAIAPALALEKQQRREHSLRVALMATARARSIGVSQEKALLAAALHDCGKYVEADSPLLSGFSCPDGVPAPVVHEYAGAYLAEHVFGISDEEILDAIRYHTSGKGNMSPLCKLIFLADMLEEGRDFPGVNSLRALFFKDVDACLYACLQHQLNYLEESRKPVYPLTKQAFDWIKGVIKA